MKIAKAVSPIAAAIALLMCGCAAPSADDTEVDSEESEETDEAQQAYAGTLQAVVTCGYGKLYANYSGGQPKDPYYGGSPLPVGKRVGIKPNAGNDNWAVVLNYGTTDWGYFLRSCMKKCIGPGNPLPQCQ